MITIGITGGTGSGKTTIVNRITSQFAAEDISVIAQDSYYKDLSHLSHDQRREINFDHPNSIDFDLLKKHLTALKKGQSIEQPQYCFVQHNRKPDTTLVIPSKILIVEGILVMSDVHLRDLFDLKVFIDVASQERLNRRILRDTTERGRAKEEVIEWYNHRLKPMHDQHIEPTKEYVDIVIPNNVRYPSEVELVIQYIKEQLS